MYCFSEELAVPANDISVKEQSKKKKEHCKLL